MISQQLASFTEKAKFDLISEDAKKQLKIRLLDSLGTAIRATEGPQVLAIRSMSEDFGGNSMSC